ncbi:MAG: DUF1289 domain-containing protein [Pseudomonadota bacterium]
MSDTRPALPPQSPCISLCTLDEADICMGCHRTVDEIIDWTMLDDAGKNAVLERVRERAASRPQVA